MSIAPLPQLSREEESELIASVIEGDREGFEIFYRLFAGSLTHFASHWLPLEEAEVVIDDLMLEAATSLDEYELGAGDDNNLAFWLLLRCRRRVIARSARARLSSDAPTIVAHRFWLELSAPEQTVVGLVHFYGLTYVETAERLNLDLSAVQEYARSARAKLGQVT